MRVVHVTDTFLPKLGGAELAIDRLCRAMGEHGASPVVVAQGQKGKGAEVTGLAYPLRRYPRPWSSIFAGPAIRKTLARVLAELGPADALVGHHAFPSGHGVVTFARDLKPRVPAVVHVRGGDIYLASRWRKKPMIWRRLAAALASADAVIVSSNDMLALAGQIVADHGTTANFKLLPNGVDPAEFRTDPDASRFANDDRFKGPFVLGLGRMISRKGFDLLIRAFDAAAPKDWRLVLAGDGADLAGLKSLAQPLGDRVVFTGPVRGVDRNFLLQRCAFMAAPSLEESFGNVALEVMTCGRPLLATRTGGFADLVDGTNGTLVPPGDLDALTHALHRLTRTDLSPFGQAALATAGQYTWHHIAARYLDLLASLKRRPPGPA